MRKNDISDKIDNKKVNELVILGKNFVKVAYILLIIVGIYAATILLKEWKIIDSIRTIVAIIAPLFIGLIISWLFEPAVTFFTKKGFKRKVATLFVYAIFLGVLAVIIGMILPLLSDQINDFVKTIPQVFDSLKNWINSVFDKFRGIDGFNVDEMEANLFNRLEEYGNSLTSSLPTIVVGIVSKIFSGIGVIVIGLIIGFYLLISFENIGDVFEFLPEKIRVDTENVIEAVNKSLRRFVQGALIDSLLVFVVSSFCLWLVGLKAPLLFGLFCGLTNVIPYAGPYIGGAPAVIVAFSQGTTTGFLTLLVIAVIQFVEGNFFQPVIMSKTTKLHPVTIMIGLLIFGYYWGIIGMVFSTPVIAALKAVFTYFDRKYDLLGFI